MKLVCLALCLVLLSVPVFAEAHYPKMDITYKDSCGEIRSIWAPHTFYFDGAGFDKPVHFVNGTAIIGSIY
jgi:hypothetical protein